MSRAEGNLITVGGEGAIRIETMGATLYFSEGPRYAAHPLEERATTVLEALAPRLQALRWCRQVHGTDVIRIDGTHRTGATCVGSGDGLLTAASGIGLLVWTADCVPVLLASQGMVAAVHAGWRGAAAGVVRSAVAQLGEEGVQPAAVRAFLGPSVSGPRYPVGEEVIDELLAGGVDDGTWLDGRHVDLRNFIAGQLRTMCINSVTMVGGCTAETPELASYRRDGVRAGRQWSLVFRSD